MIENVVSKAFANAIDRMDRVGIKSILREHDLCDISTMSSFVMTFFEDKQILDEFSQETEDDHESLESQQDEESDEGEFSFLEYPDEPNGSETVFRTKRVCDDVSSHLLKSYFKILINDEEKYVHKSTACWLLTEQNQRLSSDRKQRVTQSK